MEAGEWPSGLSGSGKATRIPLSSTSRAIYCSKTASVKDSETVPMAYVLEQFIVTPSGPGVSTFCSDFIAPSTLVAACDWLLKWLINQPIRGQVGPLQGH